MVVNYRELAEKAHKELRDLVTRRDQIQLEIDKTMRFLRATIGMLPDEERAFFRAELEAVADDYEVGITDAVRSALRSSPRKWNTATDVRDMLLDSGFNFRNYTSNPLASISTILRRMCPNEAEKIKIEGVAAYRSTSPLRRLEQHGDRNANEKHEE